jgi:hypothetical protein
MKMMPPHQPHQPHQQQQQQRWKTHPQILSLLFLGTLLVGGTIRFMRTNDTYNMNHDDNGNNKVVLVRQDHHPNGRNGGGYRFVLNHTHEDARIKAQFSVPTTNSNSNSNSNSSIHTSSHSNNNNIPLCRRYQIITGQWLAVAFEQGPPYVPTVQHIRCYASEYYHISPYSTYTWMPDLAALGKCQFQEYHPPTLCTLLPRATISIIGDSLSYEQYRSIVSLHGVPTRQGYQHQSYELRMNIVQSICEGGTTMIVYRRDDYLQDVTASIQEHFPTVLILNRGSHYVPDEELQRDIRRLIREVQAWLQQCDHMKIECYFFWRTTVPGHIGCNTTEYAISTPVYELHDIETQMIQNQSRYNEVSLDYHWYDFQRQNELVTHLFRRAKLSNFQIIDAYYLNVLRPDEHRYKTGDCLHNCYPGKMDVYNRLLLHYMQMQRSTNDIQRLQSVAQKQNWPINIHTVYNATATQLAREIRIQNELEELQQQQQQQQQQKRDKSRSSKRTNSDSED